MILGLWLVPSFVFAQDTPARPVIRPFGVLHGASMNSFGLPRGGVFLVQGAWLGPDTLVVAQPPYAVELASARIEIRSLASGEVFDAFLIHAWSFQLGAILPSGTPTGPAELTVQYEGRRSVAVEIEVVDAAPGIFSQSQEGGGPGVVQNYFSPNEQPLNGLTHPARPGQYLILWATGLGPIDAPDNAEPPVGDLPGDVVVRIGDLEVKPDYAGRAPGAPGVDQINVRLPDDERLPEGCYVRIRVTVNGRSSGQVTLAIARSGDVCEHPWGLAPERLAELDAGERLPVARLFLSDFSSLRTLGPTQEEPLRSIVAVAQMDLANVFGVARLTPSGPGFPAADGFCGSSIGLSVVFGDVVIEPIPRPPPPLNPARVEADAGAMLELLGPGGRRAELTRLAVPDDFPPAPFFPRPYQNREKLADDLYESGEWILQAAGGVDVGAFAADFSLPALPAIEPPGTIGRTEDIEVSWPVEGYELSDTVRVSLGVRVLDDQQPGQQRLGQRRVESADCWVPAQMGRVVIPRRAIEELPTPLEGLAEWSVSIHATRVLDAPTLDHAEMSFSAQRTVSVRFE